MRTSRLATMMWWLFPKPRGWRVRVYLACARRVAGWAGWIDYRAQEWVIELEELAERSTR